MTINRGYTATHKVWDRIGRITPNTEYSKSERPHFESTPASWLPVQRFDKAFEYYIVVSAGKVVAEDREGNLVPAGLRKLFNVANSSAALVYSTTDAAEGVIDLTTGVALAGAATYTEDQLTAALKGRGFILSTERAMDFISKPVGVASYNYYKAFGSDWTNPANLNQHNFRLQAITAITCDYVITLPVLPAEQATETMANAMADGAPTLGTAGWFSATAIATLIDYPDAAIGDDVVAYTFGNLPIAADTADSTIEASVAGLTNNVGSITAISAAGDYFIDTKLGILFLYEADGDAIPSPWSTAATITYYHYGSAVGASDSRTLSYALATGDLHYGDFLTYDAASNLIKATLDIGTGAGYDGSDDPFAADPDYDSADDGAISSQIEQTVDNHVGGIVGQVIGTTVFPRTALERVRTAYEGLTPKTASPYLQGPLVTPGSATGGRSDQLTYAGAAEKMVIVNLILR